MNAPWTYGAEPEPEYLDGVMMQCAVSDSKGRVVAYCDIESAPMIASAPELHAALKMIRENWAGHAEECAFVMSRYKRKCDCDWPKIAAQCDSALSKAEGKTP